MAPEREDHIKGQASFGWRVIHPPLGQNVPAKQGRQIHAFRIVFADAQWDMVLNEFFTFFKMTVAGVM